MATSDVDICNAALIHLGARRISALTDQTQEARLCNQRLGDARDFVLRHHPWNCALARASLASLTTAPNHEWDYAFTLPTDPWCLRVLEVYEHDNDEWVVEGRQLLCNSSSIKIRYIKRVTSASDIDAMCVEAIACKLAEMIAYGLTGSRAMQQEMARMYLDAVRQARTADGQEGAPPTVDASHFELVRL